MSSLRMTFFAGIVLVAGCGRFSPNGPANITIVNGVPFSNSAKVMKDEAVTKSFKTGAAPHVIVELFNGSITVTKGDDGTVEAEVTKRGGGDTEEAALEMLNKIDAQITQDGDKILVKAEIPKLDRFVGEAPAKLKMPAGAVLELQTSFSAISVTGINGAIVAKTNNGQVTVRDGKGPLRLNSSFGAIDVQGANTTVNANTNNGAVVVHGATGELTLHSSFGKIEVDAPSPKVTARTNNGAIMIRTATGELDLKTDFEKIDVDAPCTAVTARTSNGTITVKQARGPLALHSSFGGIHVETPGAEVTADTNNGQIYVRGAKGRLKAKTAFGGLDLGGDGVLVTAETSNGPLTFAGSLADGEHRFHDDFGAITLNLPADARFRIDAHTSFGSIATGFKVAIDGKPAKDHLRGTVGDHPAVSLKVSTSNGSIRINPAK